MSSPLKFSYHYYLPRLSDLAVAAGLRSLAYQPYPDYPELKTLLIYNDALLKSDGASIHISGTHGVEGAAGAEIQAQILSSYGETLAKSGRGFLMIFALNPFGFHFMRRTSIENIDLNRNTGDGLMPPPWQPSYEWLRSLWRSHSAWEQTFGLAKGLSLGAWKGMPWVVRAFAEGQVAEPEGLFYSGGHRATEITALMTNIKPLLGAKKLMTVIDVHSGLGKLYEEMLIHGAGSTLRLQEIFKKEIDIPGEKPNSYRGAGILSDRWALEFPDVDLQFIVQEFGVKSSAESFLALSLENKYHWNHFNKVAENLYRKHPIKALLFKTFFSDDEHWLTWLRSEGTTRFRQWFESSL